MMTTTIIIMEKVMLTMGKNDDNVNNNVEDEYEDNCKEKIIPGGNKRNVTYFTLHIQTLERRFLQRFLLLALVVLKNG